MPPEDDLVRVRHMFDAAEDAIRFSAGRTREDSSTDRMLLLSLVKCIESTDADAPRYAGCACCAGEACQT